jgi:hypothetical protein
VSRAIQLDLAEQIAVATVESCLDRAVGPDDGRSTGELNAALAAVAIGGDEVAAVLEGTSDPRGARTFLEEPVGRKTEDVGGLEGEETRRLEVVGVHANQDPETAEFGRKDGKTEIAIFRPLRFADEAVCLAVDAEDAGRSDECCCVVEDTGTGIDFRKSEHDEAVMLAGEGGEAFGCGSGDRFDEGGDLATIVPTVARGGHFRRHEEARTSPGGGGAE